MEVAADASPSLSLICDVASFCGVGWRGDALCCVVGWGRGEEVRW